MQNGTLLYQKYLGLPMPFFLGINRTNHTINYIFTTTLLHVFPNKVLSTLMGFEPGSSVSRVDAMTTAPRHQSKTNGPHCQRIDDMRDNIFFLCTYLCS
jgi:hypothetical protein